MFNLHKTSKIAEIAILF